MNHREVNVSPIECEIGPGEKFFTDISSKLFIWNIVWDFHSEERTRQFLTCGNISSHYLVYFALIKILLKTMTKEKKLRSQMPVPKNVISKHWNRVITSNSGGRQSLNQQILKYFNILLFSVGYCDFFLHTGTFDKMPAVFYVHIRF